MKPHRLGSIAAAVMFCGPLYGQIEVTALKRDFVLFNQVTFENTAKVITPEGSGKGAIALICGEPRPGFIVYRPLLTGNGDFNTTASQVVIKLKKFTGIDSIATDNNIIHAKGNTLFFIKNGYTWKNITPHPFWWNTIADISIFPPGARNAVYQFKSSNGKDWQHSGQIDAALVSNGEFAVPQTSKKTIGGFDRTEVYQDPWSGDLFISGHGDGGPLTEKIHPPIVHEIHKEVVFNSGDGGNSWRILKQLDKGAPLVMTSTPNGRFFGFCCTNKIPTVFYNTDLHNLKSLNDGMEVFFRTDGKRDSADIDKKVPSAVLRAIQQITICRVSTDKQTSIVCAAYSTLNKSGRQEYRFVTVKVDDAHPDSLPALSNFYSLKAANTKDNSLLYGSFIQPDYVDVASFAEFDNPILFYYVEVTNGAHPKARAKYLLFGNSGYASTSLVLLKQGYLSTGKDGSPRAWTNLRAIGDYMTGGFFYYQHSCHFLAQWVEGDGIHANIISVKKR